MSNELKGVELFSAGIWNQLRFTKDDLGKIADSFKAFVGVMRIPLKLGHNEDQKMTDGQPAIGWVGNVRLSDNGGKLLGDFVDLPDIVFKAMQKKLYNSLSIELAQDVSYKGSKYEFVLEGVALLGADLPAVNTISDLSKYIDGDSEKPVVMSRLSFSNSTKTKPEKEGKPMTVDIDEFNKLKLKFAKLEESSATEKLAFEAKELALKEESQKQLFSLKKESLDTKLETLVASKAITPAQRDLFSKKVVENDLSSIELVSDVIDTFKAPDSEGEDSKAKFSKEGKKDEEGLPADVVIVQRAKELQAKSGGSLSFKKAAEVVMYSDKDLAKDYISLTKAV